MLSKIMVAPNGARRTKADHPALPVTIGEVVEEAAKCFDAGATALHAHVRDHQGKHVLDAGLYGELISEMRIKVPLMTVQITTESVGLYSPDEQRKLVHAVMPAAVSVSLAEMLSDNNHDAAKAFYHFAQEANIKTQHILYSSEQFDQFIKCVQQGIIPDQHHQCLFVLGRYAKNQESYPTDLTPFVSKLQQADINIDWAACAFGKQETACLLAAHRLGGKCRIGFENSLWNTDGSMAKDNAERIRELVQKIEGENTHAS